MRFSDKNLTRILGILVSLMIFSPLFFWPSSYAPFSSPTLIGFLFLVELALPVYLALLVRKKNPLATLRNPLILSAGILTSILLLSTVTGVDPLNSFFGTIQRPMGSLLYLHTFLFLLYLCELFFWEPAWRNRSMVIAIISAASASLYTMGEGWIWPAFVANEGRAGSFLGNPVFLASFLILPAFFSFGYAMAVAKANRSIWVVLSGLILFAILMTVTRGAFVGLIVGFFVWLCLISKNLGKKSPSFWLLCVFGGIVGTTIIGSILLPTSRLNRLTNFSDQNTSMRLTYWNMAMEGWLDAPVLGVGPENFYRIADQRFTPELYAGTMVWPDKPHNSLLERLVTTGTLGTAAWFLFTILLFRELWKNRMNSSSTILIAGLTAHIIQGLFFFSILNSHLMLILLTAWVITMKPIDSHSTVNRRQVPILVVSCGVIIAITAISTFTLPLLTQVMAAGRGEVPQDSIIIDDLLVSKSSYLIVQQTTGTEHIQRLEDAIVFYQRSVARHPLRQAAWNDLAWLYYLKAVAQSIPVEQDGIAVAQRAIELAPGRREAPYALLLMAIHNGNASLAEQTAEYMKTLDPSSVAIAEEYLSNL